MFQSVFFLLANCCKIWPFSWVGRGREPRHPQQECLLQLQFATYALTSDLVCQIASNQKGSFAMYIFFRTVFFAPFFLKKMFKIFTIKARSFVRSVPLMLILLWDNRHPCYITKMKKINLTKKSSKSGDSFSP